jgi:rRNA maturation RNase YbeY
LLVHGLLHLFGYDHHKKKDRMEMEKIESMILRKTFGH